MHNANFYLNDLLAKYEYKLHHFFVHLFIERKQKERRMNRHKTSDGVKKLIIGKTHFDHMHKNVMVIEQNKRHENSGAGKKNREEENEENG